MEEIEVEAKSAQKAVATALKKLHAKRNEVDIKILSEEIKGLFGMGGPKQAKVKVILKKIRKHEKHLRNNLIRGGSAQGKTDRNNSVICPNCKKSEYEIFRRNNLGEEVYLNHCKCSCGQLFTYKVDKQNIAVVE